MKTIYLFRHAKPEPQGHYSNRDIPLSSEGRKLIRNLVERLQLDENLRIYTSSYRRAYETGELIGRDLIADERLIERNIGTKETFTKEIWRGQYTDSTLCNAHGESFAEVRQRVLAVINEILHKMQSGESVAVVSHAAAICAYLQQFCEVTVTDADTKQRKIMWGHNVVMEGKLQSPSCFKLVFDRNLKEIAYYE